MEVCLIISFGRKRKFKLIVLAVVTIVIFAAVVFSACIRLKTVMAEKDSSTGVQNEGQYEPQGKIRGCN